MRVPFFLIFTLGIIPYGRPSIPGRVHGAL
jgi:hypothetical protein